MFLGYKQGVKGIILFDLSNREIFLSRNIKFYENVFPFIDKQEKNAGMSNTLQDEVLTGFRSQYLEETEEGDRAEDHDIPDQRQANISNQTQGDA
jgi:hypothetical protein